MIGQYQRILLQRNTLLKDISYASALLDTLDIWDEKLSALGGVIIRMRMEYTRRLQKEAEDIYKGISMERESFSLDYRPFELPVQEGQTQREISSLLLEKMMQNRSEDLRSGSTGIGRTGMIWKFPLTAAVSALLGLRASREARCLR